jgi:hypothetical protein
MSQDKTRSCKTSIRTHIEIGRGSLFSTFLTVCRPVVGKL